MPWNLPVAADLHEQLLEAARAIIWKADPHTFQTLYVSPGARAMLGYDLEDWLNIPGFWVAHIHPDDRETVLTLTSEATRAGQTHEFEYRMLHADGRVLWLRNIVNVLLDNGQPSLLVGVTVDRTSARDAEIRAQRLRIELVEARRVSEFAELGAALAHELNQPLGAIVSNAEAAHLLLERSLASPAPELTGMLADIKADGHRATAVITNLRALWRREAPVPQATSVAEAIRSALDFAGPTLAALDITVNTRVPAVLPAARIGLVSAQEILLNLIDNAIEAMRRVPRERRQLSVEATPSGDTVTVTISDLGGGMTASAVAQAFEPFYSTRPDGLGMGLAITRRLLSAAQGTISIDSQVDRGTTVRLCLPAAHHIPAP